MSKPLSWRTYNESVSIIHQPDSLHPTKRVRLRRALTTGLSYIYGSVMASYLSAEH